MVSKRGFIAKKAIAKSLFGVVVVVVVVVLHHPTSSTHNV